MISFLASIALTAGCLMKDPKKVYGMQVTENVILIVSSACFAGNNKGLSGLLPVLATVIRTVCNYYAREIMAIKWSLFINIVLWAIYFFAILDVVSGITQVVIAVVTIASIFQLRLERRRSRHSRIKV